MNNSEKIWHALAENDVDKVVYMPCNKLNAVMRQRPENIGVWDISKESIGLGLCFGRSLAAKRSAMFMQNTGLGNLVTDLYTMQKLYQEALPIFVSWRGHYQELIEAQVIFGTKVEDLLTAIDVEYKVLETAADMEGIEEDVRSCFTEKKVKVYLCSPQLWETNSPDYHVFGQPVLNAVDVQVEGYDGTPSLQRAGAIAATMQTVNQEDIVISQIGFPSRELYNCEDRATNFYMLGALGSATEVAIGLALELPERHVYVIDGDGSFFFNPNQLFDLASMCPPNLTVICLDNGSWGSTGNQPTLSSQGYNLSALVKSLGIKHTAMTADTEVFQGMLAERLNFVHFMIEAGNKADDGEIPYTAVEIKERFMQAVN